MAVCQVCRRRIQPREVATSVRKLDAEGRLVGVLHKLCAVPRPKYFERSPTPEDMADEEARPERWDDWRDPVTVEVESVSKPDAPPYT